MRRYIIPKLYFNRISGFPENSILSLVGFGGNLEKAKIRGSDDPNNTLLIGIVNTTITPESAWLSILIGHGLYDQFLQYCLFPEDLSIDGITNCEGYNSNSYAKGLVNLVFGTIEGVTISSPARASLQILLAYPLNSIIFPGILRPVPASEFQ